MLRLTLILSGLSLTAMILIDHALGQSAEFLNAWGVVERLLGRSPAAGTSLVASRLGAIGELMLVLLVNLGIGALLALTVRLISRLVR
ncbi:MAG: hypothetical protein P8Y44_06390 [Acidobacteriota bacterium]